MTYRAKHDDRRKLRTVTEINWGETFQSDEERNRVWMTLYRKSGKHDWHHKWITAMAKADERYKMFVPQ